MSVTVTDPLGGGIVHKDPSAGPGQILRPEVGTLETGKPFVLDMREIPHWLITGATQSGKSSLLGSLIKGLSLQAVAILGIDCKGGMELGLYGGRLSALAASRQEAIEVLERVLGEIKDRMGVCRAAGTRTIWDLKSPPLPLVVIVDELAELYLTDGSKSSKDEAERCGTLLLRISQLGAALGVHLVLSGQRVGSDLGSRITALRAQMGGRVAHRSHDEASAEMTLGDLHPDAVVVAQTISDSERGVSVVASGGTWTRAKSHLLNPGDAAEIARIPAPPNPWVSTPGDTATEFGGNS
ncbi:FtsK/SpoIIIE domain-containing protein [Streptomyces albidoflavus]